MEGGEGSEVCFFLCGVVLFRGREVAFLGLWGVETALPQVATGPQRAGQAEASAGAPEFGFIFGAKPQAP